MILIRIRNAASMSKRRSGRTADAQNGAVEGLRPVVIDSHYSDEEQDPDPYECEEDPDHWWQDIFYLPETNIISLRNCC